MHACIKRQTHSRCVVRRESKCKYISRIKSFLFFTLVAHIWQRFFSVQHSFLSFSFLMMKINIPQSNHIALHCILMIRRAHMCIHDSCRSKLLKCRTVRIFIWWRTHITLKWSSHFDDSSRCRLTTVFLRHMDFENKKTKRMGKCRKNNYFRAAIKTQP